MQNNVLSLTKMHNDFILMLIASKTVQRDECDFTAFIFGCFRINYHTNMVKNTGMCLAPFIPSPAVSLIWSCVEDYHGMA